MRQIRICHINAYEDFGGSAKAALRLHQSLNMHPQISSTLLVAFPGDHSAGVVTLHSKLYKLWMKIQPHCAPLILRSQKSSNPVIHTLAWPSTGMGTYLINLLKRSQYDIVHLHFLGNSTLSIGEIGVIQQYCPVVWTLHDEWPYLGSEHYSYPYLQNKRLTSLRSSEGYLSANRLSSDSGLDIDKFLWLIKRKCWAKSFTLVCPSRWIQAKASSSLLMKNSTSVQIPNAIDISFWKPLNKEVAREALLLPKDSKIILFGATGGSHDERKGWDLLKASLFVLHEIIKKSKPQLASKILLCVFGQNEPLEELPFKVHLLGRLSDDITLRIAYNIADVFALPSRVDNLPTTGTEAQSCGIPVVAFDVGGLSDVVEHEKTGYLVSPFSVKKFAQALYKSLDAEANASLSTESRHLAVKKWSSDVVAHQHFKLYERVLGR